MFFPSGAVPQPLFTELSAANAETDAQTTEIISVSAKVTKRYNLPFFIFLPLFLPVFTRKFYL